MKHVPSLLATLLLMLMAVLAGGAARRESITFDEVAHIGAGVSYLQKLDLRMNQEHPPLSKVLAAIPLVLRGVRADYSDVSWPFSGSIFGNMLGEWSWGHSVALRWNDPYSTVLWARVPMLLLTLLLGFCIYRFASRLGGTWGGLLCLTAYVTTPAFLVFGPLVLTDIAVTLFFLLSVWSFATLWRDPNRRNMIIFGLLLAAAFLSKFSSGVLLFCFLAFRLLLRIVALPGMPTDRLELRSWRHVRGRYMWEGIGVSAIVVYVVYLILSWNQPSDSLQFLGHGTAALVLRRLLMPPWLYFRGLAFCVLGTPRQTFILGHLYKHGVWFYFPVLFLLKSTLAFLLMLVLAIPTALVAKRKLQPCGVIPAAFVFHWRALWVSLMVFIAVCLLSPMAISIRHFTIPIALLILLLAPLPRALALLSANGWRSARLAVAAYAVLALFSLVTVIRIYPYYLPFLNSLSFGHPGYELVNDSNLDWNQALPELNTLVQRRGFSHVLIDEYAVLEPTVYIPKAQFWNCQSPSPLDAGQWAFVSANMIEDDHNCLWLLHYPHQALAGGSMYLFQLPAIIPPVGASDGPPPPSAYHNFGGSPMPGDARLVFLNSIRDPNQLQPTMDRMMADYQAQQAAKREAKRLAQAQKH